MQIFIFLDIQIHLSKVQYLTRVLDSMWVVPWKEEPEKDLQEMISSKQYPAQQIHNALSTESVLYMKGLVAPTITNPQKRPDFK